MPAKKKSIWTKEDEAAFAALGVRGDELTLRNFISGQREINGKLYTAMELILEALSELRKGGPQGKGPSQADRKLAMAQAIIDAVPNSAPGCGFGGLSGNPTTPYRWKKRV
jgi:hypothetical protein